MSDDTAYTRETRRLYPDELDDPFWDEDWAAPIAPSRTLAGPSRAPWDAPAPQPAAPPDGFWEALTMLLVCLGAWLDEQARPRRIWREALGADWEQVWEERQTPAPLVPHIPIPPPPPPIHITIDGGSPGDEYVIAVRRGPPIPPPSGS